MERSNPYQTPVPDDAHHANDEEPLAEEARREDAYASEHPDSVRDDDVLFDEREPELDSDGNPVLDGDGNQVYKEREQELDSDGNPVLDGDGNQVYKEREQELDEDGNPVFDADGNQVYKGQVTEEREGVFDQERDPLFDPDAAPVATDDSADSGETRRVDDSELVAADLADNDAPTRDFTEEPVAVPEQRSAVDQDAEAGPVATPVSEDLDFDRRWHDIKAGFVDDPRHSVEEADALIDEALSALTAKRQELADRWQGADKDDTEQLRLALRDYRGLFDQLKG